MAVDKLIEEFSKANPQITSYIIEALKKGIPSKTKDADVKKILENVKEEYEASLITPNEAIGVISAQSVGAEATQMTLNTFHFAGVASQSVEGLPRLIEILDAKKNLSAPQMRVYLKDAAKSEEKLKLVADKIKQTPLVEFAKNVDIDVEEKVVTIELDLKAFKKLKIDPEGLVSYLDKKIKKNAEVDGKFLKCKGTPAAGLKDLMNIKELAMASIVYGIKGIKDVSMIKEGKEYVIITQGTSIKQVALIDEVDLSRLYCTDIHEVFANFGIEAARKVIVNELIEVVKSQGLSINERHALLIADIMTYTGEPRGMTRYGIVADKLNVMTRASFETPLKHLSRGSLMNEKNELSSITENVMTNQMVYVGTGIPKVSVKESKK